MRHALAALCIAAIVLAAGWMLIAKGLMFAVFGVIIALNLALLLAIYLAPGQFRILYRLMAWLDGLAVAALTVLTALQAQQGDAISPINVALIAVLAAKAILTRWLLRHPEPA
jgi:hypothetical protein